MVNPRQVFEAFWKTFLYHTLMFEYRNFNDFLFYLLNWPYLNEYSDIKSGAKLQGNTEWAKRITWKDNKPISENKKQGIQWTLKIWGMKIVDS